VTSKEHNTNLIISMFFYVLHDYIPCVFPLVHMQASYPPTKNPITPILAEHWNILNLNIAQKFIKM